jgi:hypothetical protein
MRVRQAARKAPGLARKEMKTIPNFAVRPVGSDNMADAVRASFIIFA